MKITKLIGHLEHLKTLRMLSEGKPVTIDFYSPGNCPGTSFSVTLTGIDGAAGALAKLQAYVDKDDDES